MAEVHFPNCQNLACYLDAAASLLDLQAFAYVQLHLNNYPSPIET